MARMRVQGSRIMISGHETTKEECNAVTLMCDEMAKSKDFRLVEYRPGYAEFEAVGQAKDLKFIQEGTNQLIWNGITFCPNDYSRQMTYVSDTQFKLTSFGNLPESMVEQGWIDADSSNDYTYTAPRKILSVGGQTWGEDGYVLGSAPPGESVSYEVILAANVTEVTMTDKEGVTLATEGKYCDKNIEVAPDATSQANLVAENIRENVSILGVTGTLSAEPGADGKTPVLTQSTINFIPSTTQNGQFTIGAEVETGDPIIIACTGSGTYEGRTWMVVGDVRSFTSTSHVAVVDVTGVTETTGEQGPRGEQGATGSPGAAGADGEDGEPPVIATQDSYSGVPVTGTSQQYTLDTWSRVPASGDDIMIMVAGQAGTASADRTFISVGTVVSATSQSPNYAVTVNVVGVQETTGQAGAAGVGVPSGGTTGQVLKKASNTNYDTEWADESGGIDSTTGGDTNFSTVSNIVTTTADSPDASSLPEGTLVIKIAS